MSKMRGVWAVVTLAGSLGVGCAGDNAKVSSLSRAEHQPCTTDVQCSHIGEYCDNGTCADLPAVSLCQYKTYGAAIQEMYEVNLNISVPYLQDWYPTAYPGFCTACTDDRPVPGNDTIIKLIPKIDYTMTTFSGGNKIQNRYISVKCVVREPDGTECSSQPAIFNSATHTVHRSYEDLPQSPPTADPSQGYGPFDLVNFADGWNCLDFAGSPDAFPNQIRLDRECSRAVAQNWSNFNVKPLPTWTFQLGSYSDAVMALLAGTCIGMPPATLADVGLLQLAVSNAVFGVDVPPNGTVWARILAAATHFVTGTIACTNIAAAACDGPQAPVLCPPTAAAVSEIITYSLAMLLLDALGDAFLQAVYYLAC